MADDKSMGAVEQDAPAEVHSGPEVTDEQLDIVDAKHDAEDAEDVREAGDRDPVTVDSGGEE